jgi:hypothetical protein
VVFGHHATHALRGRDAVEQARAVRGVAPDGRPLVFVQRPFFVQHLAGDENLAQVVNHRA